MELRKPFEFGKIRECAQGSGVDGFPDVFLSGCNRSSHTYVVDRVSVLTSPSKISRSSMSVLVKPTTIVPRTDRSSHLRS